MNIKAFEKLLYIERIVCVDARVRKKNEKRKNSTMKTNVKCGILFAFFFISSFCEQTKSVIWGYSLKIRFSIIL